MPYKKISPKGLKIIIFSILFKSNGLAMKIRMKVKTIEIYEPNCDGNQINILQFQVLQDHLVHRYLKFEKNWGMLLNRYVKLV